MNTTASRGLVAMVAAPLAAAGICANVLAVSAVAHASTVIPGVNAHASGTVSYTHLTLPTNREV